MKLLVVEKVGGSPMVPLTSSFLLETTIIYSLVGYQGFNYDVTILHEKGRGQMPESKLFKVEEYVYEDYEKKIEELSVNKYDGVIVFSSSLVKRSKNLPISNLIYCCSESDAFLDPEMEEVIKLPWVKVIGFIPSLSEVRGLKVDKFCTPVCYYEPDNADPELIKHDGFRVIVPIDYRFGSKLNELLHIMIDAISEAYPSATIVLAFIGLNIRTIMTPDDIQVVQCNTLGDYVMELLKSDLQVSYNIPYVLDLYPFMSMQFGVPVALISGPTYKKTYPYLEDAYTEILGVNSVDMNAVRDSDPGYSNYLKEQAKMHDEVQFNIKFHSALASIINVDYREEYRTSFADRMKQLEEFRRSRNQNLTNQTKNEAKDDKGDNELQESEGRAKTV